MKIAVGSTNPVKIKSSREAFTRIFEKESKTFDITPVEVKIPELNNTPNSIPEMILGARIRAEKSLELADADYGVGIEGGTFTNEIGVFLLAFSVIKSKNGEIGIGSGPAILLPQHWKVQSDKSFELGSYVDGISGKNNTKQDTGAIGLLTNDKITRQDSLTPAVLYAYYSLLNEKKNYFF